MGGLDADAACLMGVYYNIMAAAVVEQVTLFRQRSPPHHHRYLSLPGAQAFNWSQPSSACPISYLFRFYHNVLTSLVFALSLSLPILHAAKSLSEAPLGQAGTTLVGFARITYDYASSSVGKPKRVAEPEKSRC